MLSREQLLWALIARIVIQAGSHPSSTVAGRVGDFRPGQAGRRLSDLAVAEKAMKVALCRAVAMLVALLKGQPAYAVEMTGRCEGTYDESQAHSSSSKHLCLIALCHVTPTSPA